MHKQSGPNRIEWTDYTHNPTSGCKHGCKYCYARRNVNRKMGRYGRVGENPFRPLYWEANFNDPVNVKKPSRIFVGSMTDVFGDWLWMDGTGEDPSWSSELVFNRIMASIEKAPWHTYQFLTKNPLNAYKVIKFYLKETGKAIPSNVHIGTSIANQADADARIPALLRLRELGVKTLFVSYEPALGPVEYEMECVRVIDWLIIGAQTGPGAKTPEREWIESAVSQCRSAGVLVFVKNNVARLFPGAQWPQEFPGVQP